MITDVPAVITAIIVMIRINEVSGIIGRIKIVEGD
jgi:hypothetical protein